MFSARRAVAGEIALVRGITDAAYAEYEVVFGGPPLPMTEDYAPRIAAGGVWLVARDGRDVGVVVLEGGGDHLVIFSLAVRPDARGGAGRWMLGFAEERAVAAGMGEVRLYTNAKMVRNIEIYGKAGFEETGREADERRPGWVFVHMSKRLG